MQCPLCQQRQARRACPAVGRQICAVCCGTKRQVDIACPADCGYLAAAQAHPPASVRRQEERDVGFLMAMREGLSTRESELFWVILTFLAGMKADPLLRLVDEDVTEAAGALAATVRDGQSRPDLRASAAVTGVPAARHRFESPPRYPGAGRRRSRHAERRARRGRGPAAPGEGRQGGPEVRGRRTGLGPGLHHPGGHGGPRQPTRPSRKPGPHRASGAIADQAVGRLAPGLRRSA